MVSTVHASYHRCLFSSFLPPRRFLHYEDDWWIIDYEYDNNPDNVPPFAFVYYRGSNDAWDGYGGAVVYTRDDKLPESLLPRLRAAAAKVNFDFDRDFTVTDNSCPTELSEGDKILLREQFAGKVLLQSEEQLRAEITRLRGNAVSSVEEESSLVAKAIQNLENKAVEFEKEVVQDAIRLEQELVRDATKLEEEIVKDATKLEKEIVKDVEQIEERLIKRNTKVSVEVNQ
jgi:violaxanthin de-epoxidase